MPREARPHLLHFPPWSLCRSRALFLTVNPIPQFESPRGVVGQGGGAGVGREDRRVPATYGGQRGYSSLCERAEIVGL